MKKLKYITLIICIIGLVLPLFSSCGEEKTSLTNKGKSTNSFFATETKISLYDDFTKQENLDKFERVWSECKLALSDIESFCSLSVPDSDISKFNELKFGQSVVVSETTAKIFKMAFEEYELSEGLFDPTIYPLVDLWGFSPRFNDYNYSPTTPFDRKRDGGAFPVPEQKYIDGFLKLVDFSNVILSFDEKVGYSLLKNIPNVTIDGVEYSAKLDFGGIAKGYAVEQIKDILQANGYEYGYVSCGSSSMSLMKSYYPNSDANEYNLGITKPRDGFNQAVPIYAKVKIKDSSLSSSGDYEHSYVIDGKNYCHIIDPFTGYPVNVRTDVNDLPQVGISTVTLIGGSADYDDARTTALLLMTFEDLVDYVNENLSDKKVIFVLYKEGEQTFEVVTNIDSSLIEFVDEAYVLSSKIENGKIIYIGEFFKK